MTTTTAAPSLRTNAHPAGPGPAAGLVEALRLATHGRCSACLRPLATDRDWETLPEGAGKELCWDTPATCLNPATAALHELYAAAAWRWFAAHAYPRAAPTA